MRSFSLMAIIPLVLVAGVAFGRAPERNKSRTPQRFARVDKNSDGKISLPEFLGTKQGDEAKRGTQSFQKRDKNSDGGLSLEEYSADRSPQGGSTRSRARRPGQM